MSKNKSTISVLTTTKAQLVKHYNQLAKQLDSLNPSQFGTTYQHVYYQTVEAISKQMLNITGKISLLV